MVQPISGVSSTDDVTKKSFGLLKKAVLREAYIRISVIFFRMLLVFFTIDGRAIVVRWQ